MDSAATLGIFVPSLDQLVVNGAWHYTTCPLQSREHAVGSKRVYPKKVIK